MEFSLFQVILACVDAFLGCAYIFCIENSSASNLMPIGTIAVFAAGIFLQLVLAGLHRPVKMNWGYITVVVARLGAFLLFPRFQTEVRMLLLVAYVALGAWFLFFGKLHPAFHEPMTQKPHMPAKSKIVFAIAFVVGVYFMTGSAVPALLSGVGLYFYFTKNSRK